MRRLRRLLLRATLVAALIAIARRVARASRRGAGTSLPVDVAAALAGERPPLLRQRGAYRAAQVVVSDGRVVQDPGALPAGAELVVYSSWHEPLSGERGLGGPDDWANPSTLAAEANARAYAAATSHATEPRELWRGWEHIDGEAVGAVVLAVGGNGRSS